MKIAFLSHLDLNLYLFRLPIMKALVAYGHSVYAICPRGDKFDSFSEHGIIALEYKIQRESLNPFKELITIKNIYRVIEPLALDILQNFTVKPNIYGSIAATFARVPMIVNAVTGLGSFYISESKKAKAIRWVIERLYRFSNKRAKYVLFQNCDDMRYFIDKGLLKREKAVLIKSSGIDTKRFSPSDLQSVKSDKIVILMIARAIWHKGIAEYYEAAQILKSQDVKFILIGDTDVGNLSCADAAFLHSGAVEWLGHRDDIKEQIELCDIFVLPSYREGIPRTLLEAASLAKPIVTTDAIGCKEVVDDGVNGFLVRVADSASLATAIKKLIDDRNLRDSFGKNGRIKAIKEFDVDIVVKKYLDIYEKIV